MSDEITLEDFRASVLALWSSDDTPACQAAAEAIWAVACKYARTPKGTVVIDVPDQSTVRSVTSYIEAMLKDQEQLSRLIAKWHDGEVTVASKRIMCLPRGTPRKPRGVLHRIEVRGGEVTATELPDDREVAITIIAAIVSAVNGKGDIAIDNELASKLRPGMNAERFVEQWDANLKLKAAARRELEDATAGDPKHPARDYHFLMPTSVPSVPRPLPTRGEQIVSPEFEQARAFNIGKNEMSPLRLPVLTGPRWRG